MGHLEEMVAQMVQATKVNTVMLARLYQGIQQREGEKVPDTFDTRTVILNSGEWEELAGGRNFRDNVWIYNWGPCTLGFAPKKLRGPDTLTEWKTYGSSLTSSSTTATIPFGAMPVGANLKLEARSALYGISLKDSQTGSYTLVTLVEPIFAVKPNNAAPSTPGVDYVQNKGTVPTDAGVLL